MAKLNPRKRPASEADIRRAEAKAVDQAVTMVSAIFLTVIVDKFDGRDWVPEIWKEVEKLSAEIKEGRISVGDLKHVLKEEYDIYL